MRMSSHLLYIGIYVYVNIYIYIANATIIQVLFFKGSES